MFEDERRDERMFTEIADKSDGVVSPSPKTIEVFFDIVGGCVKNAAKKRMKINEVIIIYYLADVVVYYYTIIMTGSAKVGNISR